MSIRPLHLSCNFTIGDGMHEEAAYQTDPQIARLLFYPFYFWSFQSLICSSKTVKNSKVNIIGTLSCVSCYLNKR